MNKLCAIGISVVWLTGLLGSSCINYHDMPKSLKFPKEGGTRHLFCEEGSYAWSIRTYDGEELGTTLDSPEYNDSVVIPEIVTITGDWLTLKTKAYGREWEVTAAPNKSGRSRKLYIDYMIWCDYIDMKITQK